MKKLIGFVFQSFIKRQIKKIDAEIEKNDPFTAKHYPPEIPGEAMTRIFIELMPKKRCLQAFL